MRILVLGATGMLGHAVVHTLAAGENEHHVIASTRSFEPLVNLARQTDLEVIPGINVENTDSLLELFSRARPDCVINCIGLVKQRADAKDPLIVLPINAMLPHRLEHLCAAVGARLIHISTDCVFQGTRGNYAENDVADAIDLYGMSKYIGEVAGHNSITLRTSIIGHELHGAQGLLEWFLSQEGTVRGYTKVIFSGLPTIELARVIRDYVLPAEELRGLYHVAGNAISKYDLLSLIATVYRKDIRIDPDDSIRIDRSLDSSRFRNATGYVAPAWPDLVESLYASNAMKGINNV